jgi:hypothetical protein
MTNQEVFDKVWNHFIVEKNPRSISKYGIVCAYRGGAGAKCAFGLFIPDEEYLPEMEGKLVHEDYFLPFLQKWNLMENRQLLASLQTGHDSADYEAGEAERLFMERRFRETAKRFNLTIPE